MDDLAKARMMITGDDALTVLKVAAHVGLKLLPWQVDYLLDAITAGRC